MGCAASNPDRLARAKASATTMLVSEHDEPMRPPTDIVIKAITLGESGVGKTALLRALVGDEWDGHLTTTVGVDFVLLCYHCMEQSLQTGNCDRCKAKTMGTSVEPKKGPTVTIRVSDTAGQERFRTIARSYYRDADLILLCFKLGDAESLKKLEDWYKEASETCLNSAVKYLVIGLQEDRLQDLLTEYKGPFNEGPLAHLPYYHLSSRRRNRLEGLVNYLCQYCRSEMTRQLTLQKRNSTSKT